MDKNIIKKARDAYYSYIETREEIEKDIVKYLNERINENEDNIINLINITKEKFDKKEIEKIFKKVSKFKINKKITINENGFINGTLITSKGVILKELSKVEDVLECYIDAILSRNSVVIADNEYLEISVKKLILEIFQIALEKFGVNKNLIQLLPAQEIDYDEFNSYQENKEKYIYLEDEDFKNEVDKKYLVKGSLDEVIEQINKEGICDCAVIYTKDKDKAYKFLNRVNGKNVFVNTSIENMIEEIKIDEWYIHKNIIYPIK